MSFRLRWLLVALIFVVIPIGSSAQATPAPDQAPRLLNVKAPYAQQLLVAIKASHPEIKKIGLHAVPPGETESCIIANPIVSKIGKVSSAPDLAVVTSGQPTAVPRSEEGGFFDLKVPISDAKGHPFGLLVLEIPYHSAATQEIALAMGIKLRDEIAAKIPDKSSLFGPATQGD